MLKVVKEWAREEEEEEECLSPTQWGYKVYPQRDGDAADLSDRIRE